MERYVTNKWGPACVAWAMCTLAQPQHSPTSSDTSVSVFASLLSPHKRRVSFCLSSNSTYHAGRGEGIELLPPFALLPPCPVLSSKAPSPFPIRSCPQSPSTSPSRERSTDCVCASPTPRPSSSTPARYFHPLPLRYCYSLVLPAACPAVPLYFCCEIFIRPMHICAALSSNITLSSFPLYLPSTLWMQCHNSFVTSPNYPFVFCNHKFFPSLHSLVIFVLSDDHLHWNGITLVFLCPFFVCSAFTCRPYGPALHHVYFASDRRI